MGTILALDSAIRTGFCLGRVGETPTLGFVDFKREQDDTPDIFGRAVKWMARMCAEHPDIELVVIEGTVPKFDKTVQSGLWGIFSGIANAKGIRVMVAPIRTWRLNILGQGNMAGPAAKARAVEVVHLLGWECPLTGRPPRPSHDAAESACQWLWACSQVAPRQAQRVPLFMRSSAA